MADVCDEDPEVPPAGADRGRDRGEEAVTPPLEAWPAPSAERLAAAVTALAERVEEKDVRAQLHALAGILRNLGREMLGSEARVPIEAELGEAVTAGDEQRMIELMRELARLDRAAVHVVDWSAASGA